MICPWVCVCVCSRMHGQVVHSGLCRRTIYCVSNNMLACFPHICPQLWTSHCCVCLCACQRKVKGKWKGGERQGGKEERKKEGERIEAKKWWGFLAEFKITPGPSSVPASPTPSKHLSLSLSYTLLEIEREGERERLKRRASVYCCSLPKLYCCPPVQDYLRPGSRQETLQHPSLARRITWGWTAVWWAGRRGTKLPLSLRFFVLPVSSWHTFSF